ncbi:hypothetical protein D5086_004976 [Populus alba]|uniref:Uncharacterized protein n=1 Tax=Populus alba TaxID=43335 RepID=A0ACC4CSD4_POPAL
MGSEEECRSATKDTNVSVHEEREGSSPCETTGALASVPCPSMSRRYMHFCIHVSMILPLMVGSDKSEEDEEDISTQIPSL